MRFSVIIPLYNKAAYVTKALDSVLTQTYTDYECIVVDDGSADNSRQVVEQWLENNHSSLFRLICQPNKGVSTARNNGVAASQGDYVCFLDADDWWTPSFLEEMDCLISNFPAAGIYGTSYFIVKNGKNKVAPIAFDESFERGYVDYIKMYTRYLCMPLTSITVAVPRKVFDEMQGFRPQLKLGEDFDLWLRIALKYRIAMLNRQLAYYNQDVPANMRATRNMHAPEHTEYFYYSQYENEYPENKELKTLLDIKRVDCMIGYYLSAEYAEFAKVELAKVDWSKQPESMIRLYRQPKWFLKTKRSFMKLGSRVKQLIIKKIRRQ